VNHPPQAHLEALKLCLADEYRSSLYKTAKDLCGYQDMRWHTHGKMIEAIEEDTERKLIVMPRGTFKSSVCSVAAPIWWLIRNPNERILLDSEVYTNSKNFLREIKAHMASIRWLKLFGDWKTNNWNEAEITVSTRNKVYKEASITCGGIGTVKVGQHYSRIVGDDYNSGNNSGTSEARSKIITHYQMNTAILDPGGVYMIVGTRYAVDDIIGHVIQNEMTEAA
jgi:hypothetical protein